MLGYNQDFIWLQLTFLNPWEISDETQSDILSVTFWGVEYFKSKQKKEVLFGTTLYWPLLRQVTKDESREVDQIFNILRLDAILTAVFILPVITAGSLLPTWMFINSAQIIAHMPLLKTMMPGNVNYFLNKFLDWLRWHDKQFIEWLKTQHYFKNYGQNSAAYHTLLRACDYNPLFAQNMVIVIAVFLVILVVLAVVTIIDLIFTPTNRTLCGRRVRKRNSPCC